MNLYEKNQEMRNFFNEKSENYDERHKELGLKWYIEIIYGWNINVQREKTKHEIDKFIDTMKIIVMDNKEIGVTNFFEENNEFVIGLIIIHPDYQGNGIATNIINDYIDIARKENKIKK